MFSLREGSNYIWIVIIYVQHLQEKAEAEHRDKLGERDDTIPPEYRHLLDKDEEVNEGWMYIPKLLLFKPHVK